MLFSLIIDLSGLRRGLIIDLDYALDVNLDRKNGIIPPLSAKNRTTRMLLQMSMMAKGDIERGRRTVSWLMNFFKTS